MNPREYPDRPIVGVGAVIVDRDRVVLVRRAAPPRQGQWSLPGGAVELGETIREAAEREALEETGLVVEAGVVLEVLDRFNHPTSVITKSALITRDVDILGAMARRNLVRAFVSVTTLDRKLARAMEPRAATPDATSRAIAVRTFLKPGTPNSKRDKNLDARKRDYNRAIPGLFGSAELNPA